MRGLSSDQQETIALKILAIQTYSTELTDVRCDRCNYNCLEREYYNDKVDLEIEFCPLSLDLSELMPFVDKFIYYDVTSAPMPSYEDCDAQFWRLYKKFAGYKNALNRRDNG